MKTKFKLKIFFLIAGTLLFSILFWKQGIGINYFIFNIFVNISLFLFYPNFLKNKKSWIALVGTFLTSTFIIIYGSLFAAIMYFISLILLIGIVQETSVRLTFFLIFSVINNYFNSFREIKNEFDATTSQDKKFKFNKLKVVLRNIIFPVFIFIIFFVIFKFANPVFGKYADKIFENINAFFYNIFKYFSVGQIFFTFFSFTLIACILYNYNTPVFKEMDEIYSVNILRQRKGGSKIISEIFPNLNLKLGLKNEYKTALMLVISINILIAFENIIDINWFWFGFEYNESINMTQFVHEGTYLLILSILISMSLMIYYFRRNLNFYPKNKILKYANYVWIFQNIILTISVILRDYYYIYYYDLAYKRIGLIAFLILVIFGLITLFIKIKNKKSGFYLFYLNTWAAYVLLVIMSLINWDSYIANYNLTQNNRFKDLDSYFLISLSNKTLPILDQNKEKLYFENQVYNFNLNELDKKYLNFMKNYDSNNWQSWNLADYKAYKYFVNKK